MMMMKMMLKMMLMMMQQRRCEWLGPGETHALLGVDGDGDGVGDDVGGVAVGDGVC